MNSIVVRAYAKINLSLDVLRKREDGYHEIRMIMQTLDLHDTITIKKMHKDSIEVRTNLPYLPVDHRNLAFKAALLFKEAMHIGDGLQLNIHKRIPVAAGLGGGSADAAAVLEGLDRMYQTGISLQDMINLGVRLGADVPFCIMKGTALAEGIGEVLTPVKQMPDCYILLIKPNLIVSTKHVYQSLRLEHDTPHPDIDRMLHAINSHSLADMAACMGNVLESVTVRDHPVIQEIKDKLILSGSMASLMSGSGPSVFGLFDSKEAADEAYEYLSKCKYCQQIFLARPYNPVNDF